jgi:hypothetical protein
MGRRHLRDGADPPSQASDGVQAAPRQARVVCPGIPDEYTYMDPALVAILESRVPGLLGLAAEGPPCKSMVVLAPDLAHAPGPHAGSVRLGRDLPVRQPRVRVDRYAGRPPDVPPELLHGRCCRPKAVVPGITYRRAQVRTGRTGRCRSPRSFGLRSGSHRARAGYSCR